MRLSTVKLPRLGLGLILSLAVATPALACLWDYDTLNMERARFPGAFELITGKFARHSPEYYRWRVEDRKQRLATHPDDLTLYDDLAVAYDKLGQHKLAIKTILEKEAKQSGLYETYANLGTFHIHAGNLEEGLQFIDQAIEINPDAHFGREIYQRLVVQYVIAQRQDGKTILPLDQSGRDFQARGFAKFVLSQQLSSDQLADREAMLSELASATKGVMGMMRFGNHASPVLLECLADLLIADHESDNKRLAARAYLQASRQVEDESARQAYRGLASRHLQMQTMGPKTTKELSLETLDATLADEQQAANDWYRQVQQAEAGWIEEGADVDAEFKKRFLDNPVDENTTTSSVTSILESTMSSPLGFALIVLAGLMVPAMIFVVGGWYVLKSVRHSA